MARNFEKMDDFSSNRPESPTGVFQDLPKTFLFDKFSAAGKCSTEILPCLERIAEFIDQQAKSKQATAIIKDFIARVPAKLIQTRFHSEDAEVGFSTIAMTLLKVTFILVDPRKRIFR